MRNYFETLMERARVRAAIEELKRAMPFCKSEYYHTRLASLYTKEEKLTEEIDRYESDGFSFSEFLG